LEYSIIVDNSETDSGPFTINVPTTEKKATSNPAVSMPMTEQRHIQGDPESLYYPGAKEDQSELTAYRKLFL